MQLKLKLQEIRIQMKLLLFRYVLGKQFIIEPRIVQKTTTNKPSYQNYCSHRGKEIGKNRPTDNL